MSTDTLPMTAQALRLRTTVRVRHLLDPVPFLLTL